LHHSLSTLSFEDEVKLIERNLQKDKAWSLTPAAKEALQEGQKVPMPLNGVAGADRMNMQTYLRERGFLKAAADPDSSAFRTLSAAVTFPLTLAYAVNRIFGQGGSQEGMTEIMEMHKRPLKILVVGARAESSLPALWWRECLAACSLSGAISGGLHVGMVGPDLQQMRASPIDSSIDVLLHPNGAKSSDHDGAAAAAAANVAAKVYHVPEGMSTLHGHPEHMKLLLHTDLFVLFNPGLGHESLRKGWEQTVRLLCMSGKPVVYVVCCTVDCFSFRFLVAMSLSVCLSLSLFVIYLLLPVCIL
jgi:hypothetical protein